MLFDKPLKRCGLNLAKVRATLICESGGYEVSRSPVLVERRRFTESAIAKIGAAVAVGAGRHLSVGIGTNLCPMVLHGAGDDSGSCAKLLSQQLRRCGLFIRRKEVLPVDVYDPRRQMLESTRWWRLSGQEYQIFHAVECGVYVVAVV